MESSSTWRDTELPAPVPSSHSHLNPPTQGWSTHLKNYNQEKNPNKTTHHQHFFLPCVALKLPIMTTIKLINAEAQTISILQDSAACFVAEVKHFLQRFVRTDASIHLENVLCNFF